MKYNLVLHLRSSLPIGIYLLLLFESPAWGLTRIRHSVMKPGVNKAAMAAVVEANSAIDGSCGAKGGSCPPGARNKGPPGVSSAATDYGPQVKHEAQQSIIGVVPDGLKDEPAFEAISILHRQLDDDANGNIDVSESDEFLRDELQYENGYERQKTFHGNDKHISVEELWKAWAMSEVHNWTVEQTAEWLVDQVELPQYAQVFQEHSVNGTVLPRMAVPNMHFLTQVLGIKDPRHKQKIALKAMDIVLFGPQKHHNYIKDGLLVLLLVIAVGGCWFAFVQHKRSQMHMKKMMRDMDSLQNAEEALQMLQTELDKARQENLQHKNRERVGDGYLRSGRESSQPRDFAGSSGGSSPDEEELSRRQELEEDLRRTKEQLARMESALKARAWAPPAALQHWLQLTYELEQRHYNAKRAAAEMQLAAAKEGCEKIRKRRSSFLGTFRIAHGSVIDDVDSRILQARSSLSEVTKDLQERLHRWRQVELLCGFPIVQNPGLLQLEAILRGTSVANGSALSSALVFGTVRGNMSRSCSEGTLLEDDACSTTGSTAPVPSYGNIGAGSIISMPHQGYSNAQVPASDIRRDPVSQLAYSERSGPVRIGSAGSLSSESKSHLPCSGKQLHQLDEEEDDVGTDDEVDNGELDDVSEAGSATNGRSVSAPPEENFRPVFTVGNDGCGDQNADSLLKKRGRFSTRSHSQDSAHPPPHSTTSQFPNSSTIINPIEPIVEEERLSLGASAGNLSISVTSSTRRKKSGNLLTSSLRSNLNPPPTLEEENSTDSASVDDSDVRKEKKKTSMFSRLKKKSKTP